MNDSLKNRKQFPFYRSFMDALDKATNPQRLELYDAMIHYSFLGSEPRFENKTCEIFWALIKPNLDSPMQKYINGSNGGAPKGSQNNPNGRKGKGTNLKLTKNKPKTNQELSKEEEEEEEKEDNRDIIIADESAEHKQYLEDLSKDFPIVMSMKEPLTYEQCEKLADMYDKDKIRDVLNKMENYLPLKKNNKSAYRTALNWLNKDYGK